MEIKGKPSSCRIVLLVGGEEDMDEIITECIKLEENMGNCLLIKLSHYCKKDGGKSLRGTIQQETKLLVSIWIGNLIRSKRAAERLFFISCSK
jgi:hypothetical protein